MYKDQTLKKIRILHFPEILENRWEGVGLPQKFPELLQKFPNFRRNSSETSPELLSLWILRV